MAAESVINSFKKQSMRTLFEVLGYTLWEVNMNLAPVILKGLSLRGGKIRRANRPLSGNPKIITSQRTDNTLMGSQMTEHGTAAGNKQRACVVLFVNKMTEVSETCGPQAGFLPGVLTPNPTE